MTWEKVKLGDLANSIQPGPFGSQLHSSDYSDKGTPIIMPKNMDDNRIDISDLSYINESHVIRLKRHQVHTENIVFARKGDVTKSIFITQKQDGWIAGSDCIKIDFKKDLFMPYFIYLQLQSPRVKNWLEMHAIGATMPSINSGILSEVEVYLPSMRAQQKIASILSAYDDLIENNRRQIKLLEEAAERLYKEWFVKFHYPGSGNAAGPDDLPVGWNRILVKDITEIKTGKRDANFSTNDGKFPFFTCSDEMLKADSYSFSGNAVILAGNGNFRVRIFRGNFEAYQRTYVMQPFERKYIYLLYWSIKNSIKTLINGASGSTILFLKKAMIENISVIIPSPMILLTFNNYMSRIQLALEDKYEEIALLQEARDRLLPKLMSGEVEV